MSYVFFGVVFMTMCYSLSERHPTKTRCEVWRDFFRVRRSK